MAESAMTHVRFDLGPRDDGWPPVASERVWAQNVRDDIFRMENVPWFVRDLAYNDLVLATDEGDGLWARERVEWSGRMTIRVMLLGPSSTDEEALAGVIRSVEPLGVSGEIAVQFGLIALDVPPEAELLNLKRLLQSQESAGVWAYEEGCVTDDWSAL